MDGKPKSLRKKAEKILASRPESMDSLDKEEILSLLHELQVHQIELELQNDELQKNRSLIEKSQKRYQNLFENAPVGYVVLDKTGFIRHFNQTFCRMVKPVQLKKSGTAFADLLDKDSAAIFRSRFSAVYSTPGGKEMELKIPDPDTGLRVVLSIASRYDAPDPEDPANERDLLLTLIDRTNVRQAETALKKNRNFQIRLIDTIPIPVFYKDREGRYQGVNTAFESFFGLPRQKIIGKTVFDINPPELARIYHEKDQEVFRQSTPQKYESTVCNADGNHRHVIFYKARYCDEDGTPMGLIGALWDLTDQKAYERERESLITELRQALENVKQLSGLLPICSHCKKIRDDKGYWSELETYLHAHSDASFSHSICRECAQKYYPDFDIYEDYTK